MNDFLKNLEEFAAALEKCQEDNRLEKEKQEREAKRAARKAQMEKDAKNGKSAAQTGGDQKEEDGQLMNQLMAAMMARKRK